MRPSPCLHPSAVLAQSNATPSRAAACGPWWAPSHSNQESTFCPQVGQFWTRPVVFCERRPSQGARLLDSSVWPRGVPVMAKKLVCPSGVAHLPAIVADTAAIVPAHILAWTRGLLSLRCERGTDLLGHCVSLCGSPGQLLGAGTPAVPPSAAVRLQAAPGPGPRQPVSLEPFWWAPSDLVMPMTFLSLAVNHPFIGSLTFVYLPWRSAYLGSFLFFVFLSGLYAGAEPNLGLGLKPLRSRPKLSRVGQFPDRASQAPFFVLL